MARRLLARICLLAGAALFATAGTALAADQDPFRDTRPVDKNTTTYDPGEPDPAANQPEVLPGLPVMVPRESFVQFDEDSAGVGYTFSIDPDSISVAASEVRYAVLIESGKGARSLYYEGVNCPDSQYRIYAFGSADGSQYKPVRKPRWRSARAVAYNATAGYRKYLINNLLCDPVRPLPLAGIKKRLRSPGVSNRAPDESSPSIGESNL